VTEQVLKKYLKNKTFAISSENKKYYYEGDEQHSIITQKN